MMTEELQVITVFLCSLFGVLFLLPKLAHIARRIGLVDEPNARKIHVRPRPLVGGIGMVLVVMCTTLALIPVDGLRGFFLGLFILLCIGLLDDFRELGHKQKFLAQILAAFFLVYLSDAQLRSFGDLLGVGELVVPGGIFIITVVTVFCVVGVINSLNLMDGLDGLAGGISFNAFVFFALHASMGGDISIMLLSFSLAGAVLGFLKYNWHPSVLFMGDAGSLCLGFSLAFLAIILTQGQTAVMSPVAALLILAVPITDTLVIMGKRALNGASPFKPDQYHLHHILMRWGLGRSGAVRVILCLSVLLGSISLLAPVYKVPEYILFAVYLVYFGIYVVASLYIPQLLRYSYRFRLQKPRNGEAHILLKMFLGVLDSFRLLRKDKRYNVFLKIRCQDAEGERFKGKILNFSRSGCMARVKGLTSLGTSVRLTIYLPLEESDEEVSLAAEHIWVSNQNRSFFHGFRFESLQPEQEKLLKEYLSTLERKLTTAVAYHPQQ